VIRRRAFAFLLSLAALMSGLSACAGRVAVAVGPATEIPTRASAAHSFAGENLNKILISSSGTVYGMPSLDVASNIRLSALPSIWSAQTNSVSHKDEQGYQNNREGIGSDHDQRHDDAPAPNPAPSAILTFGTALLIGGGVLLLGRLREARR
jgi:hypothetical protein